MSKEGDSFINVKHLLLPDNPHPKSPLVTRREFLDMTWRALTLAAGSAAISACNLVGIPTDPDSYGDPGSERSDRFVVTDPGKVAFAAALSSDGLPQKLLEKVMKLGLESGGSFSAVVQSAEGTQEKLALELIKGSSFPPTKENTSYLVMCDKAQKRWFKVSPTDGMVGRLENGMKAIDEEIRLMGYELPDGMPRPAVKKITINGATLVAVETPYWGPTVASMLKTGEVNEIRALYQDAFYTALRMLNEKGITVRDPNPGNIARLQLKNGKIVGFVFDFESSGSPIVSPTEKNVKALISRFSKWNDRLGLGMNLNIPPELAAGVLVEKQGMIVGRVFMPKGFVDFEFSFEGLSTADIANIRNKTAELIKNSPIDDVAEVTIEGRQVALRRTVATSADDFLDDAVRAGLTSRSSTAFGVANVVLLMSIGTVDVAPGLEGMTIDVSNTYDGSIQTGHIMTYVKPDALRKRGAEYITRLKLLLRGEHAVEGDSWLTGLTITSADRAAMEYVMGMSADELLRVQREYRIPNDVLYQYLDEQLDNTQVPFKTALRFSSPFPGIPGATSDIPCWTSTYKASDGTEVVQLWLDNWETAIGFTDAPQSGQMIIPVIRWEKSPGGAWHVAFEDNARLGMGFSIARVDLPSAKCLLYTNPNKGLVMDCMLPIVNP